jgi:hypothetical protein
MKKKMMIYHQKPELKLLKLLDEDDEDEFAKKMI